MVRTRTLHCLVALLSVPTIASADNPKVVGMDFTKVQRKPTTSSIQGRGIINAGLESGAIMYVVHIELGTPPQRIAVAIDTGSSDLIDNVLVVPAKSSTYELYKDGTSAHGTNLVGFETAYEDNSSYIGWLMQDSLTIGAGGIGDLCISNAILGASIDFGTDILPISANEPKGDILGVWGLGFETGEYGFHILGNPQYPSILRRMKELAFINTKAYSLWLHDRDAGTGSILFGGVDTAKFEGPLVGLPFRLGWGETSFTGFNVQLTRVTLMDEGHANVDVSPIAWNVVPGVPALPDSGATQTTLPKEIARLIINYVKGTDISLPDDTNGHTILVPCNLKRRNLNITFEFGGWNGPKISVPIHEFVSHHHYKHAPGHHKGHQCVFELGGWDRDAAILGDTFLRSTYLVYDLENKRIAMAQSKNTEDSSIQPITNETIPGLSTVLDPLPTPTTTQVASITTHTTFYSSVGAISLGGCVVHTEPSVYTDCSGYLTQIPASTTSSMKRQDL